MQYMGLKDILLWISREKTEKMAIDRSMGIENPSTAGDCQHNQTLAEELGGRAWFSPEAKGVETQVYPQHMVAIVPISKNEEVAVDYSSEKPVLGKKKIGEDTAKFLEKVTGYSGWKEC